MLFSMGGVLPIVFVASLLLHARTCVAVRALLVSALLRGACDGVGLLPVPWVAGGLDDFLVPQHVVEVRLVVDHACVGELDHVVELKPLVVGLRVFVGQLEWLGALSCAIDV